jgi:predicted lipid carrier protein YhbT
VSRRTLFAAAATRLSDRQLSALFRPRRAKRALFRSLERSFRPELARGMEARARFELEEAGGRRRGRSPEPWWLDVSDGRATFSPGRGPSVRITVSLTVPDLVRLVAGRCDPVALLIEERAGVAGDLWMASRVLNALAPPPDD